ncbi:phosphopantetheine-binding protein [Burkholderia stagnalis]
MTEHDQMTEKLAAELARLLDVEKLDLDATIAGMGWDSMMLVELAIAAEVVYDRRINLEKLQVDFDMKLGDIFNKVDELMREMETAGPVAE